MLKLTSCRHWPLIGGLALIAASCGLKVTESPNVVDDPGSSGFGGSGPTNGTGGDVVPTPGAGGSTGTSGGRTGNPGGGANGSNDAGGGSGGRTGDTGAPPTGTGGTMGAPSGEGVMLGGQFVPKERAIAFIHFGHSNMAGRGEGPANLRPFFFTENDPRAWMFHATGPQAGFLPAKEPFTAGDGTSRSRNSGGPGTAIVKNAAAMGKPEYHFISVGFA
ncbi:MAG TPA: hypothetical protein VGF45_11715, partial [Polyangia bacterium]